MRWGRYNRRVSCAIPELFSRAAKLGREVIEFGQTILHRQHRLTVVDVNARNERHRHSRSKPGGLLICSITITSLLPRVPGSSS
jgi:hypothetical protein